MTKIKNWSSLIYWSVTADLNETESELSGPTVGGISGTNGIPESVRVSKKRILVTVTILTCTFNDTTKEILDRGFDIVYENIIYKICII